MKILIPIPHHDFDPTEVAVSWKILRDAGHEVIFATPDGAPGNADPIMISGEGLDPWGFIPGLSKLRLIGLALRAARPARLAYRALQEDSQFRNPLRYDQLRVEDYGGLLLPGGHAKGMKAYLEDARLQSFVADFFDSAKPVAAVCHGVVLAARSMSKKTGKSVLYGRTTTALTWSLEKSGWNITRFFGRFWDPDYFRTYVENTGEAAGYRGVQGEVTRNLNSAVDFLDVPRGSQHYFAKTSGMMRDTLADSRPAWVVRDGNYVSARWPGDVHTFAQTFVAVLSEHESR